MSLFHSTMKKLLDRTQWLTKNLAAANIVLANIPPKIINFHYWLLIKIFLTFGFGASGGTSQVPLRYQQPKP